VVSASERDGEDRRVVRIAGHESERGLVGRREIGPHASVRGRARASAKVPRVRPVEKGGLNALVAGLNATAVGAVGGLCVPARRPQSGTAHVAHAPVPPRPPPPSGRTLPQCALPERDCVSPKFSAKTGPGNRRPRLRPPTNPADKYRQESTFHHPHRLIVESN